MPPLQTALDGMILDPTQRTAEPHGGQLGYVRAFADPGSVDEANRRIRFVCSSATLDRYGEVVEPSAFEGSLDTFRSNPVFLASHLYSAPDGSPTSIGHWVDIGVKDGCLEGVAEFMEGDDLADKYWNRYRKSVQRAVSVGFLVRAWEMREMDVEGRRQRVRVFTEVDLVEVSAVAVPANAEALIKQNMLSLAGAADDGGDPAGDDNGASKALETTIERVLARQLDASPGGYLSVLVQDVVEHTLSHAGYSVEDDPYDHVPEPGDSPGQASASEGDEELKNELRGILGDAGGDS